MKTTIYLITLLLSLALTSCGESSSNTLFDDDVFEDGTYCADVEYYNPNTGTHSSYILNVEVESNQVTVIYWGNGGWSDEDHIYPEELDTDGYCLITSDKGYEYEIRITGDECSFTDESKIASDQEEEMESFTCPECGDEKEDYDEYCYYCKQKFTCENCGEKKSKYEDLCEYCINQEREEHTCERCGQYDSWMWSLDDLCSDCKRNDNN